MFTVPVRTQEPVPVTTPAIPRSVRVPVSFTTDTAHPATYQTYLRAPKGKRWQVQSLSLRLSTSAFVCNRRVGIAIRDSKSPTFSRFVWQDLAESEQIASCDGFYAWALGAGHHASVLDIGTTPQPWEVNSLPAIILDEDFEVAPFILQQSIADVLYVDGIIDTWDA